MLQDRKTRPARLRCPSVHGYELAMLSAHLGNTQTDLSGVNLRAKVLLHQSCGPVASSYV